MVSLTDTIVTNIQSLEISRVSFAGDWHSESLFSGMAIDHAGEQGAQVIVHVGDFGLWTWSTLYLEYLTRVLNSWEINLYFVDGNHEDFELLKTFPIGEDGTRRITERIFHLPRGFRWSWSGTSFLALGGAFSVDKGARTPGVDWFPDEEISLRDSYVAAEGGPVDIMVTHDCPNGVTIPRIALMPNLPQSLDQQAYQHRMILGSVVDQVKPKVLVHGHYHHRYNSQRVNPDNTRTQIIGLDCNHGTIDNNLIFIDLERTAATLT